MPFDPTSPLQGGYVGVSEYDRPSPPFLDTLGAAFRQENLIGSYLTSARREVDDFYKVDPAYNPFDDLKGYEDYADRFESAFNPNAAAAIKADIDKEKKDREILAASGWTGVGLQMGAAILDPTILIPGGAMVKAGRLGYRTGRSAASIGAAAGIGTAVQEAGLQATQEIRPGSESALAVGGSVLLGGLVGAAGAKFFSNAEWNAFSRSLREDLASEIPNPDEIVDTIVARAQSAGAAAVGNNIKLDDLGVGGPRIAQAIAKATAAAKINPGIQTMLSPSKKVRETYTQLVDNPIYSRMNMEGKTLGADVENLVKEYQRGMLSQWIRTSRDLYKEAKTAGFTGTKSDFYEAISKAGRRGDVDLNGNEFVTRAAQEARAKVFNPLLKRAQALGLLPEDIKVETAASYVTRLWSRETLIGREDEFRSIARDYFRKEVEKIQNIERGKAEKAIRNLQSEIDELEMGILRRGSETAEREAGGEVDFSLMSEEDIVSFIKKQKQRPKEPERLSQWLKRQRKSGIYDPKGELSSIFPEAKTVPGLLRKAYKGSDERGGDGLDDIVLRAWEDGFLNDAGATKVGRADRTSERPTIRDFLDALSRDVGGDRVVRIGDLDAARAADDFDKVMEALDRAGVNFEKPKFGTSEAMKDVAKRLNRVLDDIDRERVAKLRQRMTEGGQGRMPDFVNEADLRDYIDEVVSSVFNNLTGRGAGDVPSWLVPVKRGPLKERTFKIADALVEDFLENDMELIMRRYTRVMGAEVGLAEKFGRADMKDQLDAIGKDYEALRKQAKTPEEREKLTLDEKRDRKNLEAFRDMIRGTYRAAEESSEWSRLTRAALAWNYMRLLGGVAITSLTDIARIPAVHGIKAAMSKTLPALVSNTKAAKIARADARDLGVISETVLQSRLATLADLNDPYAYGSKFERIVSNATNVFSKATGLAWLNDTTKTIASVMTQNRILKNSARRYADLPQRERAYMAYLGISEDMAQRIAKQFEKHGVEENGIRAANLSQWDDEIARRAYGAALAKDVDRTIVTKGVADTPLWMKTNWGKALFQFKSFALASHQRVLIAGLQERPERLATMLVFGTAIGMMIDYLKLLERGDEEGAQRLLDNPGLWIAGGLDRTGILSLPFEVSNTAEKLGAPFGITTALQKMAGDEDVGGPVSRYASRNKLGAVLGPSAGLFQDLATIAEQMMDRGTDSEGREGKGLQKSGVNAIIRQIPGATLPGVRTAIHVGIKPALVDAVE